jgi:hypothetical protein
VIGLPVSGKLVSIAAVPLLAVALLAGCGGDDETSPTPGASGGNSAASENASPEAPVATAPGIVHIHGLGVDPAGGELLIATHNGLWQVPEGAAEAEPVGDSRDDFMGFTVLGPGSYLASGHPSPDSAQPPLLGLQVSSDGGESWQSRSLLGEADLHVLRASGTRVYGVDSGTGAFLVSSDSGGSWQQRQLPAPAFDMAISPNDPESLVAATQEGLFASDDAGSSWRRLAADKVGLLTWPEEQTLLLVDATGQVMSSSDGGSKFRRTGKLGAPPEAFGSGGGNVLAAVEGGRVLSSSDDGKSWTPAVEPG